MVDIKNPLFEKWPELRGQIPHVDLGLWPTPVEQLEGLADRDGSVWVKREDLSSPFYGGNKVRKLEFLLADSEKTVLTFGAFGSHHVLATAIHARRVGRSCIGFLVPEPKTEHHLKVGQLVGQHCVATVPLTLKRGWGSTGARRSPVKPHHSRPSDTEKSSREYGDFLGAHPTERVDWLDREHGRIAPGSCARYMRNSSIQLATNARLPAVFEIAAFARSATREECGVHGRGAVESSGAREAPPRNQPATDRR